MKERSEDNLRIIHMKGPDGFVQAYNAQIAVEPDLQLIVGQG